MSGDRCKYLSFLIICLDSAYLLLSLSSATGLVNKNLNKCDTAQVHLDLVRALANQVALTLGQVGQRCVAEHIFYGLFH